MLRYLLRRFAAIPLTLLALVTLSFFLLRLAPGGPFDAEQTLPPQVKANLTAAYGLDQPLLVQYAHYLRALARGDLGPSLRLRDVSVSELIARGLPISTALGLAAIAVALVCGVSLGTLAALRRRALLGRVTSLWSILSVALPSFVVGPALALLFGVYLRWLPAAGWQPDLRHLLLPVVTLALPVSAYIARLMRDSLLEVLRTDFVRTARAKGLSGARIVLRHALPPALLPVVSYLGPATAAIVTGSLVVETVFGLPGTGRYLVEGALNRDYPLVMGMVVLYGTLTLLTNLAADLLYGWLDPRVHHE
jgi:oligopeptide transport system permease protein